MRRWLAVAGMAVCLGGVVWAAPNFTGVWKLDLEKSDFGPLPSPKARTDKIEHQEPNLTLNITQEGRAREFSYQLRYTTDGKDNQNSLLGNPLHSKLHWEGDVLVIETSGSLNGNDLTIKDRWTLSPDGKTLTVQRHLAGARGSTDQKMVFEKQ
ncbi:MAG TPA: hypothetical protein VFA33_30130 [Bryobacteraceae bacterium]|nr:hypothetical protein [Bryobacteraceae bacterium]